MRRLVVPALLLLTGCAGVAGTGVPEPDRPGRAVLAHDVQGGELLWRKEVSPPLAATEPLLVAGVVLVPGDPLIAYDARSGVRLWALEGDPGEPQVAGDVVVLPHAEDVQAVDPRTGRSLWRAALEPEERVLAGVGGVVVLRDGRSGPPSAPPPASPLPDPPSRVRLLSLEGDEVWRVEVAGTAATASAAAGTVAVAGLRGDVLALDAADGRERWRTPTPVADVLLVTGPLVLARSATEVTALDATTGRQAWRQEAAGGGAPLQVVGGRVLVVQHAGTSRVLALADGRVLEEPKARDVELVASGLVEAEVDELRFQSASSGWTSSVANGSRPALWTDADDEVVVAVAGWGQPASRD